MLIFAVLSISWRAGPAKKPTGLSIGFHIKAALDRGATREEVIETLGMAIYMGAGPSVMYANHALEALTQFEGPGKKSPAV